jgi:hypothetical protein
VTDTINSVFFFAPSFHSRFPGAPMSIDTSRGHEAMDYNEHNRTYAGFIKLTQITVVALIVLLVGMYVFLV